MPGQGRNYGKGHMLAVYEHMPAAYAEASDGGRLPAPARQIAYVLRRLTELGSDLSMDYCLKGKGLGLIQRYMDDHEEETAGWDVIREARGALVEPHTRRRVALGTLAVRGYLRFDGLDNSTDDPPGFALKWKTHGPRDRYGAILYIEKNGFAEQLAADRLAERWDLAVCSSQGYSVRAVRHALVTLAKRNQVTVLVAHDFDVQGVGIYDLIRREVSAVDLGLRLDDVEDGRWRLAGQAEDVTHRRKPGGEPADPRRNLMERGASDEEIAFLRGDGHRGQRVELNALPGRRFINWLEAKLEAAGVEKLVPGEERLQEALRRAYKHALLNQALADANSDANDRAAGLDLNGTDLVAGVTRALRENRARPWDDVIAEMAQNLVEEE